MEARTGSCSSWRFRLREADVEEEGVTADSFPGSGHVDGDHGDGGGWRSFRVEALCHVQGRVEDGDGRRREEGGKLGFCGAAAGRF
jgi:hypothetical protein